jgi:RNA polymerase sigma-70 factor (ECF subfamily)
MDSESSKLLNDLEDPQGSSWDTDASDPDETVVSLIANHQVSLLSYALALVGNHADAQDLVQRTNTTVWRKRSTFEEGTNFCAWAFTIMRLHAKAFYRSQKSRRWIVYDEELAASLAEEIGADPLQTPDRRIDHLRGCLSKLPPKHRALIIERYHHGLTSEECARKHELSESGLRVTLYRLRASLRECVERAVRRERTL